MPNIVNILTVMTTVVILKDRGGSCRGFYCMGHAEYAKPGEPDVYPAPLRLRKRLLSQHPRQPSGLRHLLRSPGQKFLYPSLITKIR